MREKKMEKIIIIKNIYIKREKMRPKLSNLLQITSSHVYTSQ